MTEITDRFYGHTVTYLIGRALHCYEHWPEYCEGMATFTAPGWAVAREIEKE